MLADIPGPIQDAVQQPRAIPQRLPAQGAVALIVQARPFKFMAIDFDFGIVKKHLGLAAVPPPARRGLLAGPPHQLRIKAMERPHAVRGLGAQPFAQGGLVGHLGQPEHFQQDGILPQPLGVRQRDAAAGQGEEQLGHVRDGGKARPGAFAGIQ